MREADTAVDAAAAAPWAARAALFAALAERCTSCSAACASAFASSAAALAFAAACTACSDSSTASSVLSSARRPSDSTILTSCWISADSSSRARAMYCPVVRNHRIARGDPSSSARSAYSRTCGEAVTRMEVTSTRWSSSCAWYWPLLRKSRRAKSVPVASASEDSRFTALPPCALTVVTATWRSSCTADSKPP